MTAPLRPRALDRPSLQDLETELTRCRLVVNDFVSCSTEAELTRWRLAQQALIDAAKAVGRVEAAIDKRQRYLNKRSQQRAESSRMSLPANYFSGMVGRREPSRPVANWGGDLTKIPCEHKAELIHGWHRSYPVLPIMSENHTSLPMPTDPLSVDAARRREICRENNSWPERRVVRVDKSPMNPKIKIAQLTCGHDVYRNRAPRVGAVVVCEKCSEAGR